MRARGWRRRARPVQALRANQMMRTCGSGGQRRSGYPRSGRRYSDLLDKRLTKEVEMLQCESCPKRDAVEGVLGHVARYAGDLGQQLVDVAQKRPAATHHHALVDDVARELGWRLLEHATNRADNL